jgi:hypothetical protein
VYGEIRITDEKESDTKICRKAADAYLATLILSALLLLPILVFHAARLKNYCTSFVAFRSATFGYIDVTLRVLVIVMFAIGIGMQEACVKRLKGTYEYRGESTSKKLISLTLAALALECLCLVFVSYLFIRWLQEKYISPRRLPDRPSSGAWREKFTTPPIATKVEWHYPQSGQEKQTPAAGIRREPYPSYP